VRPWVEIVGARSIKLLNLAQQDDSSTIDAPPRTR
jgi:hypothetical protein